VESVKIDGIEIIVKRKKIRNLYVKINSLTGEAEASVSLKTPVSHIEDFLRSKINWLKKHKSRAENRPPAAKNDFVSGEKIPLFGKERVLRVFDYQGKPKVFESLGGLDLYIGAFADKEEKSKAIDDFYNAKLAKAAADFISKWTVKLNIKVSNSVLDKLRGGLFGRCSNLETGLTVISKEPEVVYKKMKSRWGVCNIAENKITLNTGLAKKTPRCIEYVVAHELLHLKERRHNKSFRDYMKKSFPDWKKSEEELKFL
jgi:predicted metal-dependent hydrolase